MKEMKKVILITGASSGMGKEVARKLIKDGHIVYGVARRTEKMNDLVDLGGYSLQMDITNEESIKGVVEKIIKERGRIDVLYNNAGYAVYGAVEDIDLKDARQQFEVNLFGLASITKAVLPIMRRQKSGLIMNVSSMGGKMYTPLGAWYHATKHAVEGWSDCLRLEVKQHGVDVVIIEPGAIATEFGEVLMDPMVERSKGGAYENMAHSVANAIKKSYEKGGASPTNVIADVVSKAINSKNPKTRYVKGKWAKPMMWMRKHLGDKMFDKIIMSQVK